MLSWVEHEKSFITSGPDLVVSLGAWCFLTSILHLQTPDLSTALTKYMETGVWFISVYNDQDKAQTISFNTNIYGKLTFQGLYTFKFDEITSL